MTLLTDNVAKCIRLGNWDEAFIIAQISSFYDTNPNPENTLFLNDIASEAILYLDDKAEQETNPSTKLDILRKEKEICKKLYSVGSDPVARDLYVRVNQSIKALERALPKK